MKIEKIHLNKIKVTFTPEDLIEHNITPEAVRDNAPWVQKVLMMVVRRAEEETGFTAHDARLMVEALPSDTGSMVMYITKLESDEDLSDALSQVKRKIKLKVRPVTPPVHNNICISFESFEDMIELSHLAEEDFTGRLYFYENRYHLIVPASAPWFVAEFGVVTSDDKVCDIISEHGKLISDDALKTIKNYF